MLENFFKDLWCLFLMLAPISVILTQGKSAEWFFNILFNLGNNKKHTRHYNPSRKPTAFNSNDRSLPEKGRPIPFHKIRR